MMGRCLGDGGPARRSGSRRWPTTGPILRRASDPAGGLDARADIVPGATFPDYELPDHTGTLRRLSLLQGSDSTVLTLNRGVYCPKDRQQLQELVPFHAKMRVGFARLVTITPRT